MSIKRKAMAGAAASAVMVMISAGAAVAQTSSASPPPTDTTVSDVTLQDVVVTAQRRSENLQNVPISVTSFSAGTLASQQISSTLDLGREVPNMFASNNVGQASANVYYIRGLGQTQSFPTFEPQVGTYIDDIYIARVNANNFALFGVQQIQVLNGPQGTLFGRNSTGGAIIVTLQKPGAEFGGDASISYGSFNGITGRASVDIPLGDQVRTRTSVFSLSNDGYVEDVTTHQTLNATHNWGAREAVVLLPKGLSNVEWDLAVDYEHNNGANLLNQPSINGGVDGSNRISYSGFSKEGGALEDLVTGDKGSYGQGAIVQSYGFSSNIKTKFDAGTLNFITGVRALQQNLGADFASVGLGPLPTADAIPTGEITLAQSLKSYQYSQEVKWSGDLGDSLSYTTGAFYMFETNRSTFAQVLGLGPDFAFPLNDQYYKNQTISEAGYLQGDYKITPQLTLTLGGRFTHEIKTIIAAPNAPKLGFTNADIQAAGYSTHLDANEFTPHASLQYQVDPNVMVFASATRGFQGGGWNGLTGANAIDFNNFAPETIWSYETGFRSQTPDHKLRVNVTTFYENVDKYQLLSDNPITGSFDTSNAANLEAYGLEANITWRPVERLTLSANIGAIHALYFDQSAGIKKQQTACTSGDTESCGSGIVRANGDLSTPVYTPPLTLSTSASYEFDFETFTATPTVSIQYVAREWFDTANTAGYAAPYPAPAGGQDAPRTLIDFGITFKPKNMPFTVTAECKNCTSVDYGTADLLGYDYYNTPGTWDVSMAYKF